jgi:hypothetical protein
MLAPVFAPELLILGAEVSAALAARAAAKSLQRVPRLALGREPPNGETIWTRRGRGVHAIKAESVNQKPGWDAEFRMPTKDGRTIRPDVGAPQRNPADPNERFLMDWKPNTPTGRAAGARKAKRYQEQTGNKTRTIYYDPKDFR